MDCEVETNLVKTTIQNLAYRGVVQIIPIFQYSNSYCVTPKIRQLLKDPGLKKVKNELYFCSALDHVSTLVGVCGKSIRRPIPPSQL